MKEQKSADKPIEKEAAKKPVATKTPAKKAAKEEAPAYGVAYIAKALDKAENLTRVALRNAGVKKSGKSYGWSTKAEADAVVKKLKKA